MLICRHTVVTLRVERQAERKSLRACGLRLQRSAATSTVTETREDKPAAISKKDCRHSGSLPKTCSQELGKWCRGALWTNSPRRDTHKFSGDTFPEDGKDR